MRQPYPNIRHSDVEWLGDVPEHWTVAQVRRWFDIVNGGTPASGEESYWEGETVWLTPDDLGRNSAVWINESRRTITEEGVRDSSARVSPEGSIILSTRAPIGHIAIAAVPAATNQGCRTLVPNPETDSTFAYYSLMASRQPLQSLGKGTTFMELTPTELGGFRIARPPLDEQRLIASFLDAETAKIDTLISRKQQLLERLAEYRTALITRTVTKGLPPEAAREAGFDPNPPMKPSGVEWLGAIPAHWEARRLKDVGTLVGGAGFPEALQGVEGEELPFFKVGDLSKAADGLRLLNSEHTISRETAKTLRAQVIPTGAIVYAKIGAALLLNRRRIIAQPSCIDNNMSAYIPRESRVVTQWALYTLSLIDFGLHVNPGAVPSLSEGDQACLPIAVPPLAEQQAIVTFLDSQTGRLNALAARVEDAIERLQEYRTALITAAVTGKLDVRDHEQVKAGARV